MARTRFKSSTIKNIPTSWTITLPRIGGRGRPISIPRFSNVPHAVRLSRGGMLFWAWMSREVSYQGISQRRMAKPRKVPSTLWREFAELSSDDDIRQFAGAWGPLRGQEIRTEAISDWHNFVLLAKALLQSAVELDKGSLGRRSDWDVICRWLDLDPSAYFGKVRWQGGGPRTPSRVRQFESYDRRALVMAALNKWLAQAPGNFFISCIKDKFVVWPAVSTLLGIVGAQLAHHITQADELTFCYHCGCLFKSGLFT